MHYSQKNKIFFIYNCLFLYNLLFLILPIFQYNVNKKFDFNQTLLIKRIFLYSELQNNNKHFTFALCFFMVLDLKLMKIGCRETTIFYLCIHLTEIFSNHLPI